MASSLEHARLDASRAVGDLVAGNAFQGIPDGPPRIDPGMHRP